MMQFLFFDLVTQLFLTYALSPKLRCYFRNLESMSFLLHVVVTDCSRVQKQTREMLFFQQKLNSLYMIEEYV